MGALTTAHERPTVDRWANRNTFWASVVADELARAGVDHVALAPGSRSTPLVLAFAGDDRFTVHTHVDERSAAFFALGLGKATGRPAAVVTTSGTAAANVYPAVIEASQAETPLLVLTADRPHRLRGTDANQTIDQVRLYGAYVRAFHDVAPPTVEPSALRHLRQLACRAVADAVGEPAGPVHFNLPFDKPLEPTPVPGDVPRDLAEDHPRAFHGRADGRPFTTIERRRASADPGPAGAADRLAELARAHPRGLIVAGPVSDPDRVGPALVALARATGYPLVADPLSGARFTPGATQHVLAHADLFLPARPGPDPGRDADAEPDPDAAPDPGEDVLAALAPTLVITVGQAPTSATITRFIEEVAARPAAHHVIVDPGHRWRDHLAAAHEALRTDAAAVCAASADRLDGPVADPAWAELWREADRRTADVLAGDDPAAEGALVACIAQVVAEARPSPGPARATLFVSNSMPVRELDAFAASADVDHVRVLGNRGASGIDGIVSTALGAAAAGHGPVVCLIGDLALLHDVGGLMAATRERLDCVFVVLDNDGGSIFHRLPIRDHEPAFTRHFVTPHGLALAPVGDLYQLPFTDCPPEAATLGDVVRQALAAGGTHIVRVPTDAAADRGREATTRARVRGVVADMLDGIRQAPLRATPEPTSDPSHAPNRPKEA